MGYPISEEIPFTIRTNDTLEEGFYIRFQGGSLNWTPLRGAYVAWIGEDTTRLPNDIFKALIIPPYKQLCYKLVCLSSFSINNTKQYVRSIY